MQLFLESDEYLIEVATQYGIWMYLILFLVIFSESALFFAIFLPGDGLLFSSGVVAAVGILNIWVLTGLLLIAGISGYIINYYIGESIGKRIVNRWKLVNMENLERAQQFYHKYGNRTFILCRFVPVVRSLVPLVAGMAKMDQEKFMTGNILGGFIWVVPLILAGFFFGELPWVRDNFVIIYLALVIITLIPLIFGFVRPIRQSQLQAVRKEETEKPG